MPPRKGKKPSLTPTVVHDWQDEPDLELLSESQRAMLSLMLESTPSIINLLREKGTLPSQTPPADHPPLQGGSLFGTPLESMATEPDFTAGIELAVLGKRAQPPSPAASAALLTNSPARVGGLTVPSGIPRGTPFSSAPVIDWNQYFQTFEGALTTLKVDHSRTPQFLGTLLTGLQSLLWDERYLTLQVDSGFSIANLLNSLPHSQQEVSTCPTWASDTIRPIPKPYAKRAKISQPTPPPKSKESPPAKAMQPTAAPDTRVTYPPVAQPAALQAL
jgi:hypothetical protein